MHESTGAHSRLGGMILVGVARPGRAVGFHVELYRAALSGSVPPFRCVCHPFTYGERKGRPCQWYGALLVVWIPMPMCMWRQQSMRMVGCWGSSRSPLTRQVSKRYSGGSCPITIGKSPGSP
jgi:hypothetical protein